MTNSKPDPAGLGREPRKIAQCKWCSAGAPIIWTYTKNRDRRGNPKRMPIDALPNPGGNVELIWNDNPASDPFAVVHAGPPGMFDDWTAYMPHHATCSRDLVDDDE